jgi:glycosyltransferase involved in cell wall biosynthesis
VDFSSDTKSTPLSTMRGAGGEATLKVSIITVTYNSASTIRHTLESVSRQVYPDIEHIIVDGKSQDDTCEIIRSFSHVNNWVSEHDNGLYDAINKGIRISTGDIIGVLHSDDFFPNENVVSRIAEIFREKKADAVFGDVAFVKPAKLDKIIRHYSSRKFHPNKFAYGYMPAHPSFYVKRKCYDDFGLYKLDYKIAADYELLMRFMHKHRISYAYAPFVMVHMRTGGVSNKSILSRYVLNKEIVKACRENGVNTNMARLSLKYFKKVFEYIGPAFGSGPNK